MINLLFKTLINLIKKMPDINKQKRLLEITKMIGKLYLYKKIAI